MKKHIPTVDLPKEKIVTEDYKLKIACVCHEFLQQCPLVCFKGSLLGYYGEIDDETLRYIIKTALNKVYNKSISNYIKKIVDEIKLQSIDPMFETAENEIHPLNGTLTTKLDDFTSDLKVCWNRLNVNYNPNASNPIIFLKYLNDLFIPEDILTIQEYLGYSLIPTNKAQKALFIVGNGGEGKSQLATVLKEIMGETMYECHFVDLEKDRFLRSNLQNKLLMVDDELQTSALKSTSIIKNLITVSTSVNVEAKFVQSYQAELKCRFLCFGNEYPKALYDKSDGFTRRLIVLQTKPKPKDRKDDPFIDEKIIAEKEAIFLWMLEGLKRLIDNDFKFTISQRTEDISDILKEDNCSIPAFLEDKNFVIMGAGYSATSKDLYQSYKEWCNENSFSPVCINSFISWIHLNEENYNLKYNKHVSGYSGIDVRGFKGIKVIRANQYIMRSPNLDEAITIASLE